MMNDEWRNIIAATLVALGFWVSAGLGADGQEVRVRVDAAHIVRTVDARLFGINAVM
jgi:CYTH domain-containing protein